MSLDAKACLAFALCTGLSVSASAEIYLNEQFENWPFTDGRATEWFVNAGSGSFHYGNPTSDTTFGSGDRFLRFQPTNNQNAQMLAVALNAPATISQSIGLEVSFDYRDNNPNAQLNRLLFGIFGGSPVTADGYQKFQNDGNAAVIEPTEDWSGYIGSLTTRSGQNYSIEYDSGANNMVDVPLQGNTQLGASVALTTPDITQTVRTGMLRLYVNGDGNVEVQLLDGLKDDPLDLIMTRVHTDTEQTTTFTSLMFRKAYNSNATNFGNTSFDNVLVESYLIPEPASAALVLTGLATLAAPTRRRGCCR